MGLSTLKLFCALAHIYITSLYYYPLLHEHGKNGGVLRPHSHNTGCSMSANRAMFYRERNAAVCCTPIQVCNSHVSERVCSTTGRSTWRQALLQTLCKHTTTGQSQPPTQGIYCAYLLSLNLLLLLLSKLLGSPV